MWSLGSRPTVENSVTIARINTVIIQRQVAILKFLSKELLEIIESYLIDRFDLDESFKCVETHPL
jgi:hypothetical protein